MKKIILKNKINKLIKACPSNWAELVAKKLEITTDAVHKRINNVQNTSPRKFNIPLLCQVFIPVIQKR